MGSCFIATYRTFRLTTEGRLSYCRPNQQSGSLAQLVEHRTFNPVAQGSSP